MFVPSSGGKSSSLPSAASGIGERGAARPQIVGDGFRKSSVISAHKNVWRPRKIRGLIRSGRPIARAWAACMVPAERQFPQGGVVLTAVAARRRPTPSAIQVAISGASPISEPLRVRGAAVAVGSKARGRHPDEPAPDGEHPKYQAGVAQGILRLSREAKDDETVVLYADGKPAEIPMFDARAACWRPENLFFSGAREGMRLSDAAHSAEDLAARIWQSAACRAAILKVHLGCRGARRVARRQSLNRACAFSGAHAY